MLILLTNTSTQSPISSVWLNLSMWVLVALIATSFGVIIGVKNRKLREAIIRLVLFGAGGLSLLLGIIGIFLPIMPTVPFVILTAMCWGRASPRFHYWLVQHKLFGPMIRDWLERRAIPRRAKYIAWSMMTLSCCFVTHRLWTKHPDYLWGAWLTWGICIAVAIWMSRQPDA